MYKLWKIFLKSVDLIVTLKLEELKKTDLTVFEKSNFSKNELFIFRG